MVVVRTILSDLVAEQQSLDQYLQKIPVRDWSTPTAVEGWDIRDTVSHLAHFEELAAQTVLGEPPPAAYFDAFGDLVWEGIQRGRDIRPQDVIEWWRKGRATLIEPLSEMSASQRTPWFNGTVPAKNVAANRLTETWAYGLDIYEAVGEEYEDTTRIRHICELGWVTLPSQYEDHGEQYHPIRVEVIGPQYYKWVYGDEDSPHCIKGSASEWARLAVHRLGPSETTLECSTEYAEQALEMVSIY
ncbi:MAG: maleylpyruvate isomerase family mycothiol-dependent enzyme [bacterium]|nr:maleylpyruvate isomerase family mycothiol-dependent enzyme [Acidimicrobiia bacterium]MCY4649178.1 maleylpyruvate isomerase family mycothiol-dependent enzyme [bacterium]